MDSIQDNLWAQLREDLRSLKVLVLKAERGDQGAEEEGRKLLAEAQIKRAFLNGSDFEEENLDV